MANVLKARKTSTGLMFRIWSDESDSYVTEPITEEQLRKLLLEEAIREHQREVTVRIERATQRGTSSVFETFEDINGKW